MSNNKKFLTYKLRTKRLSAVFFNNQSLTQNVHKDVTLYVKHMAIIKTLTLGDNLLKNNQKN